MSFSSVYLGLFTADQQLKGDTSIFTRQNAAGTRSGYECPEERDYYPYWHPTDWIDIAVFTDNTSLCDNYKENSFNVKAKGSILFFLLVKIGCECFVLCLRASNIV